MRFLKYETLLLPYSGNYIILISHMNSFMTLNITNGVMNLRIGKFYHV